MATNTINYVYIVQEREFIKTNESIYKIGQSKRSDKKDPTLTKRINEYPKGSKLILCKIVDDCLCTEKNIKNHFKQQFIQRVDIGKEYFEGDIKLIKTEFMNVVNGNNNNLIENNNLINTKNNNLSDEDDNTNDLIDIENNNLSDEDDNTNDLIDIENTNIVTKKHTINYTCYKCNMRFNKKSNYDKHMNRKTPCIEAEKKSYDESKRTCKYCNCMFARPQTLRNHLNICKMKPTEAEELKQIIINLNNKIEKQNVDLKEIKQKLIIIEK